MPHRPPYRPRRHLRPWNPLKCRLRYPRYRLPHPPNRQKCKPLVDQLLAQIPILILAHLKVSKKKICKKLHETNSPTSPFLFIYASITSLFQDFYFDDLLRHAVDKGNSFIMTILSIVCTQLQSYQTLVYRVKNPVSDC